MNPLFSVMQRVSLHYYVIITYYYVIITPGSLITRYNLFQTFQSPELADVTEQRFSLCLAAASRGCSWLGNSDCQEIRQQMLGPVTWQESEISLDTGQVAARNKRSSEWKCQIYRMWKVLVKTGVHRQTA